MKLSKVKLIKLLKPGIEKLGFIEFKDSITGAQGLFCKKIKSDFYLTLALSIHRYYDSAFVGEFTFSRCTIPYLSWGDIPKEMNIRLGHLLTAEERSIYIEDEINVKEAYDIWWDGKDEKSIFDFLRVIELTEPRFINQKDLIEKINQSNEIEILSDYSEKVKKIVRENQIEGEYTFLPHKELDEIPIIWFKASEKVLKENMGILNNYTVSRLAGDAFRQKQL